MSYNFRPSKSTAKSPATPARTSRSKPSFFSSNAPSTTPTVPPPSYLTNTNKSTTPQGNPPRSSHLFGSSYNAAANTFGHRTGTPGRKGGRSFAVPESSPPPGDDDGEDAEVDDLYVDDLVMEMGMDEGYGTQTGRNGGMVGFGSSLAQRSSPQRGWKRSRDGELREQGEGVTSRMAEIARRVAREEGEAQVPGSDEVVLRTEAILADLHHAVQTTTSTRQAEVVLDASAHLSKLWSTPAQTKTRSGGIGPESDDSLAKASYLASLLLQLHHPHAATPQSKSRSSHAEPLATPLALLNWLKTHHTPLPDDYPEVSQHRPSPSAHESFWDICGSELLRGNFARVVRLLTDAGFENAVTALDDGGQVAGYHGKQLENVEIVVEDFVRVVGSCPAVTDADWDVRDAEWAAFRLRVRRAMRQLEEFNKGDNDTEGVVNNDAETNIFARSSAFAASANASISASTHRAFARVPWTVYENLKTLYGVLLGGEEILDFAQDWVEATILLTVWWDGEEAQSTYGRESLRASRGQAFTTSGVAIGRREVDVAPLAAYRKRLGRCFRLVTQEIGVEEPSFQPDSLDLIQVGLGCIFEDATEAVVALLRTWDRSVGAAVVEVAEAGGWLPGSHAASMAGLQRNGFSSEDLMVLSLGPEFRQSQQMMPGGEMTKAGILDREALLTGYATLLASRDVFTSSDGRLGREGWDLAVSVLGRVDSSAARDEVEAILQALPLESEARVERILSVCDAMGSEAGMGRAVAERYADTLASIDSAPKAWGTALLYYARSHNLEKLKSTIALLTSLSTVHSTAYPPQADLDSNFTSLLSSDRTALVKLAAVDAEAAGYLGREISGYALLRRFYTLRDGITKNPASAKRKRDAAKALVALISSAADCVRGGLYDASVAEGAAIPVSLLLVLLGETLALLGGEKAVLTKQQVFTLLEIVEDFETAPGRIRDAAVEVLSGALAAYRSETGSDNAGPKAAFGSMSKSGETGGLGGSSWDVILAASSETILSSHGNEGGLTRAWDWRVGLDAVVGAEVGQRALLLLLRTALAEEVARGWGGGWSV